MAAAAEGPGALTPQAIPPLALALAATASAAFGLEAHEAALRAACGAAVGALDAADAAYQRAVDGVLSPAAAQELRAAIAAFRDAAGAARERARLAIDELYRRAGERYGPFDPLDGYLPPTTGLSHADATRVATRADAARAEVDALRARSNAALAERLAPAAIAALLAAKLERRRAFAAALEDALTAAVPRAALDLRERAKAVEHLARLAEGWY